MPERHSFCGFPFGNAPSMPESPGTLLSSWASPTHGAGGCVAVLLPSLLRLQKRTQRPQTYKYLCFSVAEQAELSGLCQISREKRCCVKECGVLVLRPSWTGALGALRDGKHISKAKYKNAVSGSRGKKNTSINMLHIFVAPGSLGSSRCSYVPISGAGCGCSCLANRSWAVLGISLNLHITQISYTWVFRLLCLVYCIHMLLSLYIPYRLAPFFLFFLFRGENKKGNKSKTKISHLRVQVCFSFVCG